MAGWTCGKGAGRSKQKFGVSTLLEAMSWQSRPSWDPRHCSPPLLSQGENPCPPSGCGGGGAMRHDPHGFVIDECSRLSVEVPCSEWYGDPIGPTSNLVTHCIACTYLLHATMSSFHHLCSLVQSTLLGLGRGSSLAAVGWCRCDKVQCFLQGGMWLNIVISPS